MMITSQYFTDSCDIYSYGTDLKGNTEVAKTLTHETIPCLAYKTSNLKMPLIIGDSIVDTYRILIPHTYAESNITVDKHYKIVLTKNGSTYKLRAEGVTKLKSHWEVEAVEENV